VVRRIGLRSGIGGRLDREQSSAVRSSFSEIGYAGAYILQRSLLLVPCGLGLSAAP